MCRIAGIISTILPEKELLGKITVMCDKLAHGGPDDEGVYLSAASGLVFGHRRLAIIDLSANGHQPMADANGQAWITFNGEIFNYPELKAELLNLNAVFNTDTDTEVIIQAYLQWGTKAFAKLRGIFAFALHDTVQALTYLVRDTSGVKPLYYHTDGDGISFASEVKALKAAGLATLPDQDWPIRFLSFGHIPEPYTTLKNVLSLPKGHFLCWDHQNNGHQILPYHLDFKSASKITNIAEAQKNVHTVLNQAVKRQLLADAPIGVFLSGGIDSSLITLLAHQYKADQLKTVSIFFDEQAFDERDYQNIILEKTGAENHSHLVKQQDFEDELPDIMAGMDMPTIDGINTWFISKYASGDGLKAVLSGLGGDELFGGYPSFKNIKYLRHLKIVPSIILNTIAKLSVGKLKRLSLLSHSHPVAEYLFLRGLFVPAETARILNIDEQHVLNVLFDTPLNLQHLTDTERAAWYEANFYMQNQLLRDTDVMSMAHGLEVRVPFLDEDFVQTVDRVAPDIRFDHSKPKRLLVESFRDLIPASIWNRRKMGFSFPLQQWMQAHSQIADVDFYKGRQARRAIRRFRDNKLHWSKAFALYQLEKQASLKTVIPTKKILLLTLQTYGATGGIQKMTRTMGHVLQKIAGKRSWRFSLWSGYDNPADVDANYTLAGNFKGFGKKRSEFALKAVAEGLRSDKVILSHINLAPIGLAVKLLKPKCRLWIIAHGIEVWRPLNPIKRKLLAKCDKIICVSNFTRQKMIDMHGVDAAKCVVLNNALDSFIKLPTDFTKPAALLERYQLKPEHKVIFTLTRLASTEQYKGYEQVIKAVSLLKGEFPDIKYVLSGKYDTREDVRIKELIKRFEVQQQVIVTGFIDEAELSDHFLLADLFVLPSKKEGFGIVFIEALASGLPVICGNEDGSLDAIRNGELGKAINVDDITELKNTISHYLETPLKASNRKELQDKCVRYFNTNDYMDTLEKMLTE